MKRFVISFILVFALTSHAYGMGWLGGGHHNDNGSVVKTSGNAQSGTTGNNNGQQGQNGQQDQSGSNTHAVPEPLTLLLLGSGLIGLVALRKKFKK
jgi:hypothetical protein